MLIATVLRSGGEYGPKQVEALHDQVRHLMPDSLFVCLADCDVPCETIPLQTDWPRWWPKLELFREFKNQPTLYLDLDTILIKPIRLKVRPGEFWMLRDFGKPEPASGMMAWNGDFSHIFHSMTIKPDQAEWDQRHIAKHVSPQYFQDNLTGIYSYKKHCRGGLPGDASVVCFHGKPRPWQVTDAWVRARYGNRDAYQNTNHF